MHLWGTTRRSIGIVASWAKLLRAVNIRSAAFARRLKSSVATSTAIYVALSSFGRHEIIFWSSGDVVSTINQLLYLKRESINCSVQNS